MNLQMLIIKNANIVNEGKITTADVLIENEKIAQVGSISPTANALVIDASGKYLLPGIIDCQVHFREPGLTHKGDIYSESKAAVAGGVTSFIEMPNTIPNVLTKEILNEKYRIASQKSLANYAFFLGVNANNINSILQTALSDVIGLSDDGLYFSEHNSLLADHPAKLEILFENCKKIVAIHSENSKLIAENENHFRKQYGEGIPPKFHSLIRSEKSCYQATKQAVSLAAKHNARLHILHLTTEAETHLFRNDIPLSEKKITTEVSIPHLCFSDDDYEKLGTLIKCNPSIKTKKDKEGLFQALIDDRIDLITTDHAPHTLEEKNQTYFKAMPGMPMVQHSLNVMLEFYLQGKVTLEKIVEKMCHNPAILYRIKKRGFIREGYYADLTLVDLNSPWKVNKENLLYKCAWSPLEGKTFHNKITHTLVNGNLVYDNGKFHDFIPGHQLEFNQKNN